MSEIRSRRRRSDQRNLLYKESSLWGVYVVIGMAVLAFSVLLALYLLE